MYTLTHTLITHTHTKKIIFKKWRAKGEDTDANFWSPCASARPPAYTYPHIQKPKYAVPNSGLNLTFNEFHMFKAV